ncbi:MAG: copper resistance protein CopC [Chloroflexi bacterium]|nr:copper resistance protein CopC [Chloroflexota bacterium]
MACALAVAWALSAPPAASAHARVAASSPGPGEVLQSSPAALEITFNEALRNEDGAFDIAVNRDRGGSVVSSAPMADAADKKRLSIGLQSGLTAGRYVVTWSATSGEDGAATTGAFSFYVKKQPTPVDIQNDNQLASVGATPGSTPPGGATITPAPTRVAVTAVPSVIPTRAAASPVATPASESNNAVAAPYVIAAVLVVASVLAGIGYLWVRRRAGA